MKIPKLMILLASVSLFSHHRTGVGVQILSKSKLEKCEKRSNDDDNLNCTNKIVINLAVPSGSSGRESSIVAELVEVEENSSQAMRTLRIPPVITVNKSAAYALYQLTYIRDVPYQPLEFTVKTRKCRYDAGANIVKNCERLRDEHGHVIEYTEPVCCPCGPHSRLPTSCGNVFDKMLKGKANTAHCLRFAGDWFHVFGVGQRTIGFSVRIEVKAGSKVSEVILGPDNRTAASSDNLLRASIIGDFGGYTNIPTFEDFYLVIPRQDAPGQPQNLGMNISMWMLLERVRFTLDGIDCNKIGVGYEAFRRQPSFCGSPVHSCLHNQLWNYWEADQNRITRRQLPLYTVVGRFERINQHPNPGSHSFSIGVAETLNTNLLLELTADDIEYVYQRSPGKIINVTVPKFEALTQFGIAAISTKNIGEVEASYSLTFDCSKGVSLMEEHYFIMKPKESVVRTFKLYPTTDQAAMYTCSAILKDSDYTEVDRAECQFSTMATVYDNSSQIPFEPPKTGANGLFGSIERIWKNLWEALMDFVTGKTCRSKCSGFFDFNCHIQYICMSWVVLFGLFLAIFPTVLVVIWLLHQKGLFDPLYDWWEDHFQLDNQRTRYTYRHEVEYHHHHHNNVHGKKHYKSKVRYHKHVGHGRKGVHIDHKYQKSERDTDYDHYLHEVRKDRHKHGHNKYSSKILQQALLDGGENDHGRHHHHRKDHRVHRRSIHDETY